MSYSELLKNLGTQEDADAWEALLNNGGVAPSVRTQVAPTQVEQEQISRGQALKRALANHFSGQPYSFPNSYTEPETANVPAIPNYGNLEGWAEDNGADYMLYNPESSVVEPVSAENEAENATYPEEQEYGYSEPSPVDAQEAQENEIAKVAEVASGGNPYKVGAGLPSLVDVAMNMHGSRNSLAQDIGRKLSKRERLEQAYPLPTNFADDFYKMRLAHALRAQGTPTAEVNNFMQTHAGELDRAIKRARAEENLYALQKAISGNNINAADLALGHLVVDAPDIAQFMANRVPSFRNWWDVQQARETQQIAADRQYANQVGLNAINYGQKLDYLYKAAEVDLNKLMAGSKIKDEVDRERRRGILKELISYGYDPNVAVQMAFGASGGRGTQQNNQPKLTQKQQQFANEYEHRFEEAKRQVATGDTSSTALGDMGNWLQEHKYEFSPEEWEKIYGPVYDLEERWKKLGEEQK